MHLIFWDFHPEIGLFPGGMACTFVQAIPPSAKALSISGGTDASL
jgi:hypothetical protein